MSTTRMTIRLPEDLKQELDDHPEINWSEIARQSMRSYLHKLEIADEITAASQLTDTEARELSDRLKGDIAAHYETESELDDEKQ